MTYIKNFFFNGDEFYVKNYITINEMLNYFNFENNFFVIEYNGIICHEKEWPTIRINSNDKIELITIVGGG